MTPLFLAAVLSAMPIFQDTTPQPATVPPMVLAPRPLSDFEYVEGWFYLMEFTNGYRFDANVYLSNMAIRKMTPAVEFAIFTPDGKRLAHQHYGAPKEVRFARDRFDLAIGPDRFSGDPPHLHLKVGDSELGADLDLDCATPPWRLGDGKVRFGERRDKFWEFNVACPKGVARGVLYVHGATVPVEGVGYADHSRQNVINTSYSRRWFNVRLLDGPATLDAIEFETKDGRHFGAWVALDGDRVLSEGSTCRYELSGDETDPDYGHALPRTIRFQCPGTAAVEGTITTARKLEGVDVLAQLPWVLRSFIKAFIIQPYIYRLANRYEMTFRGPDGVRKITGRGFEEFDFLKE